MNFFFLKFAKKHSKLEKSLQHQQIKNFPPIFLSLYLNSLTFQMTTPKKLLQKMAWNAQQVENCLCFLLTRVWAGNLGGEAERPRCFLCSPSVIFCCCFEIKKKTDFNFFLFLNSKNFFRSHHSINFFNYLLPIFSFSTFLFFCWFSLCWKKVLPSMFFPWERALRVFSINHSADFLIIFWEKEKRKKAKGCRLSRKKNKRRDFDTFSPIGTKTTKRIHLKIYFL